MLHDDDLSIIILGQFIQSIYSSKARVSAVMQIMQIKAVMQIEGVTKSTVVLIFTATDTLQSMQIYSLTLSSLSVCLFLQYFFKINIETSNLSYT